MNKIIILLILLAASVSAQEINLGVTPSNVLAENVLPGTTYNTEITISKTSLTNVDVTIEKTGVIGAWISSPESITMNQNTNEYVMQLAVYVPHDAVPGRYFGKVNVVMRPDMQGDIINEIVLPIDITIDVTDKTVKEYDIRSMKIHGSRLFFDIDNKGNVPAAPTYLKIEYLNRYKNEILDRQTIRGIDEVPAFEKELQAVELPLGLPPGNYWARVSVYDKDIVAEETLPFEITGNYIAAPPCEQNNISFLVYSMLAIGILGIIVWRWGYQ